MSNRERWTVYPLLFLTLGIALRDKITGSIMLRSVRCEELVVAGQDGKLHLRLGPGGRGTSDVMVIYGQQNNPSVSLGTVDGSSGILTLHDARGKVQVVAKSTGNAGAIETLNSSGQPQILLGSNNAGGVVTTARHGKTAISLGAQEDQDAVGLTVCADDGMPRVQVHSVNDRGTVQTLNAEGVQVVLKSSDRGGIVSAIDNDQNLAITLGHEAQGSGVFAVNFRNNQMITIPLMPLMPPRSGQPGPPRPIPPVQPPAGQPKQEKPQAEPPQQEPEKQDQKEQEAPAKEQSE